MMIGAAGFGPEDPAHFDAGQLGEHQIEQDEVRPVGPESGQRLTAVGCLDDPEAVGLERLGEHLPQGGLVIDDEDRPCHLRLSIDARVNGPFADGKHRRAGLGPRRARRAAQRAARSRSGNSM